MKFADIKHKDRKELMQILQDARIKTGKFRFELSSKALKDFSQIGKAKKDIARILTALRANK